MPRVNLIRKELVPLSQGLRFESLPRQVASEEVHVHVAEGFEVIPP